MIDPDRDAWMQLPPFDRLLGRMRAATSPDTPVNPRATVPIMLAMKGTRVRLYIGAGADEIGVEFCYRTSVGEWQLFRLRESKWKSQGPASHAVTQLLEKILVTLLDSNASLVSSTPL